MPGIQELIIIILIIIILSVTGLWPTVMQGLRELRGERTEGTPSGRTASGGVQCARRRVIFVFAYWGFPLRRPGRRLKRHIVRKQSCIILIWGGMRMRCGR